jgi:hypothetical protein
MVRAEKGPKGSGREVVCVSREEVGRIDANKIDPEDPVLGRKEAPLLLVWVEFEPGYLLVALKHLFKQCQQ